MLKKSLIVPFLLAWCALHLLTPFVAVCSTSCRGIRPTPVSTPSSHACCVNNLKPSTEIKSSLACVCPIMSRKPARLETEAVLSPLEGKEKVQPIAFGNGDHRISTRIAATSLSPPSLLPLHSPDCSGTHSILRI
jgi:hypothetical protein